MAEQPPRGDVPGIQIHMVRRFRAARPDLWRWLTDGDHLRRWLADEVRVDLGDGGGFRLETLREDAAPVLETGSTIALDHERRWCLEFRREDPLWEGVTILDLTVRDTEGGCELEVFQEGFQRLALSSCLTIWEEYRSRWRAALDRLEQASSSAAE